MLALSFVVSFLFCHWQKKEDLFLRGLECNDSFAVVLKGLWVIHSLSLQPQVIQLAGFWNGWKLMPHHWDCASSSPVADGWINRRMMEPLRELSSLQSYRQQSIYHVSKMPFCQDTPSLRKIKSHQLMQLYRLDLFLELALKNL